MVGKFSLFNYLNKTQSSVITESTESIDRSKSELEDET